jgi:hypothetical protein
MDHAEFLVAIRYKAAELEHLCKDRFGEGTSEHLIINMTLSNVLVESKHLDQPRLRLVKR